MRDIFTLLGTQGAIVGQPQRSSGSHRQTHPHNEETRNTEQILCQGVRFLARRRKPEHPEKTHKASMESANQIHIYTTTGKLHWWKTKCKST